MFIIKKSICEWPENAAMCKVVNPSLVVILDFAPNLTSNFARGKFPTKQHRCKGVWPSWTFLYGLMVIKICSNSDTEFYTECCKESNTEGYIEYLT